jgi:adenylate cyclase
VRITAQLIDGTSGNHLWAERYDRDLSDIFALQDEISRAIVDALKIRLLPGEKTAFGQRGTNNAEAYRLVLMARQHVANAQHSGSDPVAQRFYQRAIEMDPNYAFAWAALGRLQFIAYMNGESTDNGLAAVEHALKIDPNLAEAHSSMGRIYRDQGREEDALREHALALTLDPESYEVNREAGVTFLQLRRLDDAIKCLEKATALAETEFKSIAMVVQAHEAKGDIPAMREAGKRAMKRIEAYIARTPNDGRTLALGAAILASLREAASAKEWAAHAMLVSPNDIDVSYNLACAMSILGEQELALDYLVPYFAGVRDKSLLIWASADTDLDRVRELPRFKQMAAEAEARLAAEI